MFDKTRTCAFTGHRPEKLTLSAEELEIRLETAIRQAITDGYDTFVHGAQRGVDLIAAMTVLRLQKEYPRIRLITAIPFEGFDRDFEPEWKAALDLAKKSSEAVITVSKSRGKAGFFERDEWMVDHASRLIAVYNGKSGGTGHTMEYAGRKGIRDILNLSKTQSISQYA